ncbi:MAG: hypothetical protein AVDCRST_MAG68-5055 [uncultured Gemmatimonadetes bacterium]|uniref:Uncharacterized protein n=1 Tax=uncultured Gemmatimonadota bacterium TaxID=203437 RepID=A0A6J4MNS0_9BACT|nr:MAG: hypothetical protein AVDCRST_MAG68-5055 [uncultured Gemmatimonadota bacterium]
MRRPGVGKAWPPDDSWTIAELNAELAVWRTYAALRPYAVSTRRASAVSVPVQRRPCDARWERLTEAAFRVHREPHRARVQRWQPGARGHL